MAIDFLEAATALLEDRGVMHDLDGVVLSRDGDARACALGGALRGRGVERPRVESGAVGRNAASRMYALCHPEAPHRHASARQVYCEVACVSARSAPSLPSAPPAALPCHVLGAV